MFGKDRQLYAVMCLRSAPRRRPPARAQGTPRRATGHAPEAFLIITTSGGVDRNQGPRGCSLVTRKGEQGRAGCCQRPGEDVHCVGAQPPAAVRR
jgi:hypothetical protein